MWSDTVYSQRTAISHLTVLTGDHLVLRLHVHWPLVFRSKLKSSVSYIQLFCMNRLVL